MPGMALVTAPAKKAAKVKADEVDAMIQQIGFVTWADADLIYSAEGGMTDRVDLKLSLQGYPVKEYIRVELEGMNEHWICNSTPFWVK